jgi:UDP-glucose 4,6-dehydratase
MNILTLGNGFVASHLPYPIVKERIPLLEEEEIEKLFLKYTPDVIVNTIGYCGVPNIDSCENEKVKTFIANTTIPTLLASVTEKLGIKMIHIGSGCIFSGPSPSFIDQQNERNRYFDNSEYVDLLEHYDSGWLEEDDANPKSYYSKTKWATDLAIGSLPHVTTLRIRMPISSKNTPRNFINKVRNYSKVIDIPNSMTLMDDLVRAVDFFAHKNLPGIYHVVNPEPITAAQVMREYQKYHPEHQFEVIDESELDNLTVAKRSNCLLNGDKLSRARFTMTPSKEALETCMKQYVQNMEIDGK